MSENSQQPPKGRRPLFQTPVEPPARPSSSDDAVAIDIREAVLSEDPAKLRASVRMPRAARPKPEPPSLDRPPLPPSRPRGRHSEPALPRPYRIHGRS